MKILLPIALSFLLSGSAMAQFRGGMAGGFRGGFGGFSRGAVVSGAFRGGGFRGGFGFGGFHGGRAIVRFRSGFGNRFVGRFYQPFVYYPYWGFGLSYWPDYYDYSYQTYAPYNYSYPSYEPNVTVVYPPPAQATTPSTTYVESARPVVREYDEQGREITSNPAAAATSSPPVYLIAFRNDVIYAATAYWVDGKTLHYVTLQHKQEQAPLDTVDRDFSLQLNRERHVQFSLPSQ